ncbi:FAD/NAD(P)-binding oxidoreductase [Oxyplasma meridianum]|uniref:FAD/NAD(P)-binding oxidoreductase n=1 Tax=Oxyplasma meridianum TaxID=3073602 RepID=A0AAX4NHY0_9ARCH
MVLAKRVVILGDGSAGITFANKLRKVTVPGEIEITIIGNSQRHFYKADGLFVSFGLKNYRGSLKNSKFLLNGGVDYLRDEAEKINYEDRVVHLKSGKTFVYDYLIVATGNRLAPEEMPGYEGEAKHFFDLNKSMELKMALDTTSSGNVLIAQPKGPLQYSPSLVEFALLLNGHLEQRGIRDKVSITYTTPEENVSEVSAISSFAEEAFEKCNIEYATGFAPKSINSKNKEIVSENGDSKKYSLLVMPPPHRGQKFIEESGMAGDFGYMDVDKRRLNYGKFDDIFAIGDTANLPVVKTGSGAHYQATYLASRIAHEVVGGLYDFEYDGKLSLTTLAGIDKAFTVHSSYEKIPNTTIPNKSDFLLKYTSSDTYFSSLVRGVL